LAYHSISAAKALLAQLMPRPILAHIKYNVRENARVGQIEIVVQMTVDHTMKKPFPCNKLLS